MKTRISIALIIVVCLAMTGTEIYGQGWGGPQGGWNQQQDQQNQQGSWGQQRGQGGGWGNQGQGQGGGWGGPGQGQQGGWGGPGQGNMQQRGGFGQQGGDRMQQMQDRMQQMSEELMNFLNKYAPNAAREVNALRNQDNNQYMQKMMEYRRSYGQVLSYSDTNPELCKACVARVALQDQVDATVDSLSANANNATALQQSQRTLYNQLGTLFDAIVKEQQGLLFEMKKELTANNGNNNNQMAQQDQQQQQGRGNRGNNMMGNFGQRGGFGGFGRGPVTQERLQQREADIKSWATNKEKLVKLRFDELTINVSRFPWDSGF